MWHSSDPRLWFSSPAEVYILTPDPVRAKVSDEGIITFDGMTIDVWEENYRWTTPPTKDTTTP